MITTLLYLAVNFSQIGFQEKKALAELQHTVASKLDRELPDITFEEWFSNIVGSKAGVIYQLTECGETVTSGEKDILACIEANAVLFDKRKVIVFINIGTFKKGFTTTPSFLSAVIEIDDQLYSVGLLKDLPKMIQNPGLLTAPVELPSIGTDITIMTSDVSNIPSTNPNVAEASLGLTTQLPPPPPHVKDSDANKNQEANVVQTSTALTPQKVSEGVIQGSVISRVKPPYPLRAKQFHASGNVVVAIVVGKNGYVKSAKAISGHPTLRSASEEAAKKWIFSQTKVNGQPVEVESTLTFSFNSVQ